MRPSTLLLSAVALAASAACVESAPPKAPAKTGSAPTSSFDPCANGKPVWRDYKGPLKAARCEQEMFLTMGGIADQLGVDCNHCHAPKSDGLKGYNYDVMTPNKEKALWMSQTFMSNLKRVDGKPMTCGSCHVDKKGKPAAKFLGQPRDTAWAVEWMTTVMTTRFVDAQGQKLKCKSCHVGTWGTPQFEPVVIGRTAQVPHGAGETAAEAPASAEPTPSATAAPAASSAGAAPSAPAPKAPVTPGPAPSARPSAAPAQGAGRP